MIKVPSEAPAASASATDAMASGGLIPQLQMMYQALWASPVRNSLFMLAASLFTVIAATAYGQILLNNWNKPFYDALSRRDFGEFLRQLSVFGLIAGTLLVLNVAQRWLGEMSKVKLREGLVQDLVRNWMQPGRASRLAHSGPIGVNPDQRMHEDARHLTELSADLAIGLLQATILLGTFIQVLWTISSQFVFHVGGHDIVIPGYMVWAAVAYSAVSSLVSLWVGSSLVDRNADHYAREADLRYSLVRINDHIDAIALAGGEAHEVRYIETDLAAVLAAMRRLVMGLTNLTWVTAGSGWITIVAPIIAAAPLYFAGKISFGGLMLASGAFMQVQSSLRWFVDNFSTIADWRATLLRVAQFRRAITDDAPRGADSRIVMAEGATDRIGIENLEITTSSGTTRLAEQSVEIERGDRVLIVGDTGARKTLVFRALAGLWPMGSGRITRPAGEPMMYIPRTPYLPPRPLRDVLSYPSTADTVVTQTFADALVRVGLERLVPQLDSTRRWDQALTEDEQQALMFARVLVRRPPWLLVDEVFDGLDKPSLERIYGVLAKELAHTGVIYIGRENAEPNPFTRILHLVYARSDAAATAPPD